ncbi:alpha-ketoacid dehydrogenase subunit beta [Spiroplasma platyhelix]|uniref:Alpha-ketoacid dehydrogenase subunit beta n=1 Tax=Spiroplasma platyhelix PALS-1 TaxID=1276218 RepID=A0A846TW26_9MOLU|nr:alpha-ketoacid dehydrogenase subunit beta [Spiroplasma platyhelix]MBE4703989.1 Pyruvate dehydrogenase E1 component subunit beta [Spiroplasma platyhelix PALS-1]NKE38362.1 alpha-ketoacid dehydrogenase subunit beta [Spiroplasma platyhelix PALS-1]UJB29247.1 pyruvate dehydrogenase E1 component subunit beta [Spiroplasma platyhelix PALS-1]
MKRNNVQAISLALDLAMQKHDNVVIYGEDVGNVGGVFRATRGLQKKFGAERCFDAPIAEAVIAGTAVGASINGLRPVVEMQFSGFAFPAMQQLFAHAARMRNRSRGRYHCPIVVRMPSYDWNNGANGALEHHSEAIEALFCHIPGLKVVMTSKPNDTKKLLLAAIEDNDPVIFLECLGTYFNSYKENEYSYNVQEEVSDDYEVAELGKAKVLKSYQESENPDLTIVTYGAKVYDCEYAVKSLEEQGFKVELIDLQTLQPWDETTIIESVKKTGRILVVQEAVKSFSVASEIVTVVNEKCFEYLKCPPTRIAGYDITVPLSKGEKWFLITPDKIIAKATEMIKYPV